MVLEKVLKSNNVPGTLVPRATKAMALTESFRKMKHPRCPATSPMIAVTRPIMRMDVTKVAYPLNKPIQRVEAKSYMYIHLNRLHT